MENLEKQSVLGRQTKHREVAFGSREFPFSDVRSLGINVRSVGIKIFIVILFSYLLVMENFEHTCKSREQIMNSHVPIIKFH